MYPCYWLFCTAVEERKGQNRRQAVDQRPHEFVFVVWQRGRIHKSSDSSHPVSGLSWAEVLPSEGMSLGVLFLVGIHKCEPEGDEDHFNWCCLQQRWAHLWPDETKRARSPPTCWSTRPQVPIKGVDVQKDIPVFEKSAFATKKVWNFLQNHEVLGHVVECKPLSAQLKPPRMGPNQYDSGVCLDFPKGKMSRRWCILNNNFPTKWLLYNFIFLI